MRKKLAIALGLIVVVAGLFLAEWWTGPREPQLRVGMTEQDVATVLSDYYACSRSGRPGYLPRHNTYTFIGPANLLGRSLVVRVVFIDKGQVQSWSAEPVIWPHNSWWGQAKDALGL